MRIVVAGGGTGGHFFPGLAVAEVMAAGDKEKVLFVGDAERIEARVAPLRGYAFEPMQVSAFRGGGVGGILRFLARLPRAMAVARRALRGFAPDLVLGLGGYGSVPVVLSARLLGIPSVLMEQNVIPGQANRLLSRFATRVCTTFDESEPYFPAGVCVRTGNPVRDLSSDGRPDARRFDVLVFGGSQGAHSVNRAMIGSLARLQGSVPSLRVTHQTGKMDYEAVKAAYDEHAVEATVLEFIDDMAAAYAAAHLVVCRSGASTLSEVAVVGKPALLVPYPFAADDHQRRNAEVFAQRGAAEMILDEDLSGATLAAAIETLARDPERLEKMGHAAKSLAIADAAERVAEVCRETVGR